MEQLTAAPFQLRPRYGGDAMIGQTISHYRIADKIGEGGMGSVYKAEDLTLKRTVALKFLSRRTLEDEDQKARFLREAQAAAGLDHPNICTVYEVEEAAGETFIAMAYLDGRNLRDRIAAGPLEIDEAVDLAEQVAQGLRAAHKKEVVHRDIKPANVIVHNRGCREDCRLWLGPAWWRGSADERRGHPRHDGLHVTGAGDGRPAQSQDRHLVPRRSHLRTGHRAGAFSRTLRRCHRVFDRQ